MGVTDERRREVAARLRRYAYDQLESRGLLCTLKKSLEAEGTWRDVFLALADLIGSDTAAPPRDAAGCDREKLLGLERAVRGMAAQCDERGRYALATTFRAIEERIREACGPDDDGGTE